MPYVDGPIKYRVMEWDDGDWQPASKKMHDTEAETRAELRQLKAEDKAALITDSRYKVTACRAWLDKKTGRTLYVPAREDFVV
jgi:hypothetical protein